MALVASAVPSRQPRNLGRRAGCDRTVTQPRHTLCGASFTPVLACRDVSDTEKAELGPTERRLVSVCHAINENPLPKRLQTKFLHMIGRRWVRFFTGNRLDVRGMEHAQALKPSTGVLLCSNHRSFFDMYVVSSVFLNHHVPWYQQQFFPVRSNFFYETWAGLGVNLVMGGGAMYPPIFRERSRADINKRSVKRIIDFLQEPGVVVGMHPEGTRGKGPDPYELLRAQPGVGQMALQANVPVLPVWVSGIGNDLTGQLKLNWAAPDKREPIIIRVGAPVDLDDLREKKGRVTIYKRAADRILDRIRDMGHQVRAESQLSACPRQSSPPSTGPCER